MSGMNELREHLFDALRGLKSGSIKVDQAAAMNATAQTLINSVKAEIDFLKLPPERIGSGFIRAEDGYNVAASPVKKLTSNGTQNTVPVPGGNVVTHRMRG